MTGGLRRLSATALAFLALGGATVAVAACGAEEETAPQDEPPTLGSRPGKLTCQQWRAGTRAERLGTIGDLTTVASDNANPDDVGPARTLSDEDAYTVLDTWCSERVGRGFLLYEIYNRAAAFSGTDGP
jgi:hypothetical protein